MLKTGPSSIRKVLITIALVILSASLHGQEAPGITVVQGAHSGAYGDKNNAYNGIFVEVLNSASSPTGKQVVLTWYAFLNGQQVWILAVGDVIIKDDQFVAVMTAWIYEGNDFPPDYDDAQTLEIVWGEIIFQFIGCDGAILIWSSIIEGFGEGEIEFERRTTIADTVCDPGLNIGPLKDDHADSWHRATPFPQPRYYAQGIPGILDINDTDVFTFTLTETRLISLYTFDSPDIATNGVLYRLQNNTETKIAESLNQQQLLAFSIVELLGPGTYTIHVTGQPGTYTVWIQSEEPP